jgi:hypothetical protein
MPGSPRGTPSRVAPAPKLPDLGKMVGPLPLGAWVGVVGGGLGLAYVVRRGQRAEEPEVPQFRPPPYPATPVTSGPSILQPAPPAEPGPRPITDNTEWIAAAVMALVTKGFAPLKTQQCLAAYLEGVIPAGDPGSCRLAIEEAIRTVGPPPTGAPVNQFPLTPPAPPKAPTVPGPAKPAPPPPGADLPIKPVVLYWYGFAMYITNGRQRSRYGLSKAHADRYQKRYPVINRIGPGGPGRGYPIHDRLVPVANPATIAPIP